jgi:hypothetical protein
MERYYWLKNQIFLPMIDTIGQKSNIFNLWIDTVPSV